MDEDWSPDGGNTVSLGDESDEYQPPKTRRRTSSRKRNMSSDRSKDRDTVEISKPRRSRRHSHTHEPINLENSASDDNNDSEDIVVISPKPSKQRGTRKRKAEDIEIADDDDSPPLKKRRISNTNSSMCDTSGGPTKKETPLLGKSKSKSKPKTKSKSKTGKSAKKVLLKGNEATERLKEFMISQNRPHSKNSAHSELLGAISVGQIQKSLDALAEAGVLVMKEFGNKSKTKIYWADQDTLEAADAETDEDEAEMMARMKELEMSVKRKKEMLNSIKKEIAQLKKEPTDEELEMKRDQTLVLYQRSKEKLNELRENQDENLLVSQEDLDEKLTMFYKYGKAWKERKAVVMDMVSQVFQECSDKPDKILTKKLNGETDKENDVEWENYKEIYKLSARLVQQKKDKARRR